MTIFYCYVRSIGHMQPNQSFHRILRIKPCKAGEFKRWAFVKTGEFMLKKIASTFVLCFSVVLSSHAANLKSATTIELSKPGDVIDATAINSAIDSLSNKVMACVKNTNAEPNKCYCQYLQELVQLRDAYEKALKVHPAWQDQVLFWWRDGKHNYSYNLSLRSVRMQLEKKCPTHPSSGTPNGDPYVKR